MAPLAQHGAGAVEAPAENVFTLRQQSQCLQPPCASWGRGGCGPQCWSTEPSSSQAAAPARVGSSCRTRCGVSGRMEPEGGIRCSICRDSAEGGGSSSSQPGPCEPALGRILCWRAVSFQPTLSPWLCSSLPRGQGSALEGDPQQTPAVGHKMVLGWAGQRRELSRDGLWVLLAVHCGCWLEASSLCRD